MDDKIEFNSFIIYIEMWYVCSQQLVQPVHLINKAVKIY